MLHQEQFQQTKRIALPLVGPSREVLEVSTYAVVPSTLLIRVVHASPQPVRRRRRTAPLIHSMPPEMRGPHMKEAASMTSFSSSALLLNDGQFRHGLI